MGGNNGSWRGNNGGGFFINGPDGEDVRARFDAEVRARFGGEAVDRVQRDRALREHPRQLTDQERAQLQAALAPILRDMRATGAPLPDIVPEARFDRGEEFVCAWITEGGRQGCGITVWVSMPLAEQVSGLAEQLAEWASDEQLGRTPPWPACPDHPGEHHLWPDTEAGQAVWKCGDQAVSRIGALPGSEPEWEAPT